MSQPIYLDWRPLAVDSITDELYPLREYDLDNEDDFKHVESIQRRFFARKYYFPVYLEQNFKKLSFQMRVDGIFAFSFEKRRSSKLGDVELAQFASYFIKSALGHTHDNDQSPYDISKNVKNHPVTLRRVTNFPVKIATWEEDAWQFSRKDISDVQVKKYKSLKGSFNYCLSHDGLTSTLVLNEEKKPTKDIAVLKIKKNFAEMFDLTEFATQGLTSNRHNITLACILLGSYCSMLLANAVGYLSQNDSVNHTFWYGHPLALLIVVPFVLSLFRRYVYRPLLKPLLDGITDRVLSKDAFVESKHLVFHNFYPFFFKFIYNKNMANNSIVAISISILVLVLFKDSWDFVLHLMGVPSYQIDDGMWDLSAGHFNTPSGIKVLCFCMILVTIMNFFPKLWNYRAPKFKAWQICLGYLQFGNIYCQILENIFYQERRRRAVGFQHSEKIAFLKLQSERYKYISDCLAFSIFLIIPFITVWLGTD